jgi:hypothetical protein
MHRARSAPGRSPEESGSTPRRNLILSNARRFVVAASPLVGSRPPFVGKLRAIA